MKKSGVRQRRGTTWPPRRAARQRRRNAARVLATRVLATRVLAAHVLAALGLLAGCDAGDSPAPVIDLAACHRLTLIDAASQAPVSGLEDLVRDETTGLIIASAHDRWQVEDSIAEGRPALPQGGLFVIPLSADALAAARLTVRNAAAAFAADHGLRPHGLGLYRAPGEHHATLAVINRRYKRLTEGKRFTWTPDTRLEVFDWDGQTLSHRRTITDARLCRANDVVAVDHDRFLVSRDHGACGGRSAGLEDLFGLARAEVLRVTLGQATEPPVITVAAGGIAFANGLALDRTRGHLYVAATRARAVLRYDLDQILASSGVHPSARYDLGAGPDNLSWDDQGRLIAAVHPSLWRLGFYRKRWLGQSRAPSRVNRLDPQTEAVTNLFSDPTGAAFSAATSALETDGFLILGSVAERGLMVCARTPALDASEGGS